MKILVVIAIFLAIIVCFDNRVCLAFDIFSDSTYHHKHIMQENVVKNAFIVHGAYGTPEENWFPWLANELENQGLKVYVPQFPTPEQQTLENWFQTFRNYVSVLNEESIMIGHSLGPAFILNILETIDFSVKACFLVSPFIGLLNNPTFDKVNSTFVDKNFNWDKIKNNCRNFTIYSSDSDPYVPLVKGEFLADKIGAKFKVIHNAGHFNKASGYTSFPLLLKDIEAVVN
jgi:uncharacterized protein